MSRDSRLRLGGCACPQPVRSGRTQSSQLTLPYRRRGRLRHRAAGRSTSHLRAGAAAAQVTRTRVRYHRSGGFPRAIPIVSSGRTGASETTCFPRCDTSTVEGAKVTRVRPFSRSRGSGFAFGGAGHQGVSRYRENHSRARCKTEGRGAFRAPTSSRMSGRISAKYSIARSRIRGLFSGTTPRRQP